MKISHKKLHACFFEKKTKDQSKRGQLQSNWQIELKSGWGLYIRPEFCIWYSPSLGTPRGQVYPSPALLIPLILFTHSLNPSPSTQPMRNTNTDSLYCVHPDSVSKITAYHTCVKLSYRHPLPSINDYQVSSAHQSWEWIHAVGVTWAGSMAVSGHDLRLGALETSSAQEKVLLTWAGWVHFLKLEQQQ